MTTISAPLTLNQDGTISAVLFARDHPPAHQLGDTVTLTDPETGAQIIGTITTTETQWNDNPPTWRTQLAVTPERLS